ncbi:MAG: hypothetical protein H0W08_20010 [Acidobacteria bacterium]|nr:hypothetical protein [Acidobacteriota bacterium]
MRLVKSLGPTDHAAIPVGQVMPDPSTIVPVSEELFEICRRSYSYDRTPLASQVDAVDDSSPF